jgi:2-oxoglutarate/2-oxoacid ferredoxin oxidoreductase subunit beta
MRRGYEWGEEIPIGLFWKRTDLPALDALEPVLAEGGPLARRKLGVSPEAAKSLIQELM